MLILVAVFLVAWRGVTSAQRFSTMVDKGQTVNSSLYSAGKTVDISGTINGDVYCAGQTVTIDAIVHGDVICTGMDVTVAGRVDGDVRIAGQTVAVEADISRSASVAAMTFSLDADARVGQDLTAVGNSLNIKGKVGRDVVAEASTVILNGGIGRNGRVESSVPRLKNDAAIAGNLSYTSPRKAEITSGATVAGQTKHIVSEQKNASWRFDLKFYLYVLSALLLLGLSLAFFFPQFMGSNAGRIKRSFGKSLLTGKIASVLMPLLLAVLGFTIVGLPLAIVLLLALLLGASWHVRVTKYA